MKIKVSLDLDDTVFNWNDYYKQIFGEPKNDLEVTKRIARMLLKDKKFWLSQPLINIPNFIPHCYCTARIIPKSLIKKQIQINNLPNVPVYQVFGFSLSKYSQLRRANIDVHIDDSVKNFIDLNSKGIPCLLIDRPHNQEWGPIGRIFSLNKEEIEESYFLFKDTMFDYFKDLVDDYRREVLR